MSHTKLLEDNHFSTENKVDIVDRQQQKINSYNGESKCKINKRNEVSTGHDHGFEESGNSKISNSYVASFFTNLNDTVIKIQLLNNSWKLTATCQDKTENYNSVMETFSYEAAADHVECLETVWLPFIKYSNTEEADRDRQYAFSIVLMKDGRKEILHEVYPKFQNKKKNSGALNIEQGKSGLTIKTTLHSEEILIQQLDDFLHRNGTTVEHILIYTYNSPCLKRENRIVSCMFQLLYKAYEWYKLYGVITDVAFTKHWGLSGPNYFRNLTYSSISCPSSVFHSCIEKCREIPFKLDHKKIRSIFKISGIYDIFSLSKDKEKLHKDIKSVQKSLVSLAENSPCLYQDHLDCGYQTIDSFIFGSEVHHKLCKMLREEWTEMVDDSSATPIRKYITEQFNTAVVHLFREQLEAFLGKSSPLRLRRVQKLQLCAESV